MTEGRKGRKGQGDDKDVVAEKETKEKEGVAHC